MNDLDKIRALNLLCYNQSLVIYRMLLLRLGVRNNNRR